MHFTLDDPRLREVEDKEAWLKEANDTFYRQKKRGGKDEMCEALAVAAANAAVKKPAKEQEPDEKNLSSHKESAEMNPDEDFVEGEESAEIEGTFEPLVEATPSNDGVFLAKVVGPGWGTSGYYSADVIKRDIGIYKEGLPTFWNHPSKEEERNRPERDLRDMAGKLIEDAHWEDNGPMGPGAYAKIQAYTPYRSAIREMQTDIGLSHRALGMRKFGEAEGKKGPIVERMVTAASVDFVTAAGRGGAVTELFEAARNRAWEAMDEVRGKEEAPEAHDIEWGEITLDGIKRSRPDLIESLRSEIKQAVYAEKKTMEEVKRMNDDEVRELQEAKANLEVEKDGLLDEVKRLQEAETFRAAEKIVREKVSASELPEITKARLNESLAKKPIITDGKLDEDKFSQYVDEAIKSETEYVAKLTESGKVKGMGQGGGEGTASLKESLTKLYMRQGKTKEAAETLAEAAANARR